MEAGPRYLLFLFLVSSVDLSELLLSLPAPWYFKTKAKRESHTAAQAWLAQQAR